MARSAAALWEQVHTVADAGRKRKKKKKRWEREKGFSAARQIRSEKSNEAYRLARTVWADDQRQW